MRKFEVNGKTYIAKPFDFNMVCDLEELGVSLEQFDSKPMNLARAYIGICSGLSRQATGEEMQQHMIDGKSFDELFQVIAAEIEDSDFFQALNKGTEAESPKVEAPKRTKKTSATAEK